MLAVQRQPNPIHNSPIIRSRLLVQPTKTPGLLSLSKPQSQQQRRQPREPRGSPKSKQPSNTPTKTTSAALVKPLTSTPSPRGRINNSGKPKSSPPRSSSRSSVRVRRSDRQPSPPAVLLFHSDEVPSDEEATMKDRVFTPSATLFDPFIDNVQADQKASQSSSPSRKAVFPTLTERPSGKLAKRRQPSVASTATSSTPIVPPATPSQSSKSAPVPVPKANRRSSPVPRSNSQPDPAPIAGLLPICDDSEVPVAIHSPVTPVRPKSYGTNHGRTHSYGDLSGFDSRGPKTAPILSSFSIGGQDFFQSPSPASRAQTVKTRSRQRVPSVDSVFTRNVMDLPVRSTTTVPSTSDDEYQKMKAAFFASSSFQNSPSPDDLPPPDF